MYDRPPRRRSSITPGGGQGRPYYDEPEPHQRDHALSPGPEGRGAARRRSSVQAVMPASSHEQAGLEYYDQRREQEDNVPLEPLDARSPERRRSYDGGRRRSYDGGSRRASGGGEPSQQQDGLLDMRRRDDRGYNDDRGEEGRGRLQPSPSRWEGGQGSEASPSRRGSFSGQDRHSEEPLQQQPPVRRASILQQQRDELARKKQEQEQEREEDVPPQSNRRRSLDARMASDAHGGPRSVPSEGIVQPRRRRSLDMQSPPLIQLRSPPPPSPAFMSPADGGNEGAPRRADRYAHAGDVEELDVEEELLQLSPDRYHQQAFSPVPVRDEGPSPVPRRRRSLQSPAISADAQAAIQGRRRGSAAIDFQSPSIGQDEAPQPRQRRRSVDGRGMMSPQQGGSAQDDYLYRR